MNFTPNERQALLHRLAMPEAIAKALGLNFQETEWDCALLSMRIAGGRGLVISVLSQEEHIVLLDCVQGSTWATSIEGEPNYYAACQTLTKLARKFEAEGLGSNIVVPT